MAFLRYRKYWMTKKVALAISRGTSAGSCSYIVEVEADGVVGLGEAAELDIAVYQEDATRIERDLQYCQDLLSRFHPFQRNSIEGTLLHSGIGSSTRAAIDMALYDWAGKSAGLPVWKMLGLESTPRGPTSVTIGINTPEGAQARLGKWMELGTIRAVKIKLGSTLGIDADKKMFEAVRAIAPKNAYLGVDANGGWTLEQALEMLSWLQAKGVVHVEQPLPVAENHRLEFLKKMSTMPIFIDESCRSCKDIIAWGHHVDGINIKITKCGGLSEALRMIATAHAMELKTMVGCYGNSSLGNGAAHQLASLIDYIDLDSHLNISNDPCTGLGLVDGFLINRDVPGLGIDYA